MAYRHLSSDEFQRRVKSAYYKSRKAGMLAIRSASWSETDRARAILVLERVFPGDYSHLLSLLRALVFDRPELEPHVKAIEAVLAEPGAKRVAERRKAAAPRPAAPPQLRLASAPDNSDILKHDITALFDNPDDDEDEPDPEEGPVTAEPMPTVAGANPEEVARVFTPRPDLENAIAEGDADDSLDEKQKAALRAATQTLIAMRDAKKASH